MISPLDYINWTIVWNLISCHPVCTITTVLSLWLVYKIISFKEIIVDCQPEVPPETRILPGQKIPPYYPNGWIPILESAAIKRNEVKSVQCFGQELAVVRGAKGQVYVFDAFCPHLGANLAVGGTVHRDECEQDCIRCPFHGWSFRAQNGECSNVPYEDAPTNAKLKVWPNIEINNAIFVWHHADQQEPSWHLKQVKEIACNEWVYQGRTEHYVNCHIQEIPENGADVAHLGEIHVEPFLLGSNLNVINRMKKYIRGLEHEWHAQWNQCSAPNEHMSHIDIINNNKVLGITLFKVELKVNQIGPGYVELRFYANFLGGVKGVLLQFVTPIGPMRNSIVHQVYTENTLAGYIFGKFLLIGEARMLERDIQIWNRKAFLQRPYVAKSEKSLVKYRRWYRQFYSENERSLNW